LTVLQSDHLKKKITQYKAHILGAFAILRKVTISFFMSVRLFARNNSAPTGRIFTKFDI